jgi:hypothetical protein
MVYHVLRASLTPPRGSGPLFDRLAGNTFPFGIDSGRSYATIAALVTLLRKGRRQRGDGGFLGLITTRPVAVPC